MMAMAPHKHLPRVEEKCLKTTNNSIHHVWNFLWLGCLRVGFGVDVFDLDFGVQTYSIEQPVKRKSMSSGNMSH